MNEQSYDDGPAIGQRFTWDNCLFDQYEKACQYFCDNPQNFSWLTQDQVDLACMWKDAKDPSAVSIAGECLLLDNIPWCTYACIYIKDHN